jgi:hypothetical protein
LKKVHLFLTTPPPPQKLKEGPYVIFLHFLLKFLVKVIQQNNDVDYFVDLLFGQNNG